MTLSRSDRVPTTREVRERFVDGFPMDTWAVSRAECAEDFDRWLAAHDAEVREAALASREAEAGAHHHFVQLTIQGGELHPAFVCTAPGDAICRRRPDDFDEGERESWSAEEATEAGYSCWAVDWVEAVGIPDAIFAHPDGVLASVPVRIRYSEGVEVTPVPAVQEGDKSNG